MFGSKIISRGPGDFVCDYELSLPTGNPLSPHGLEHNLFGQACKNQQEQDLRCSGFPWAPPVTLIIGLIDAVMTHIFGCISLTAVQ